MPVFYLFIPYPYPCLIKYYSDSKIDAIYDANYGISGEKFLIKFREKFPNFPTEDKTIMDFFNGIVKQEKSFFRKGFREGALSYQDEKAKSNS